MRLNKFHLLYIQISWHKYARLRTIFDFMTEIKIQKNQIKFLEDREVIWPQPKKINCCTFLKLLFEQKISDSNAHANS